MDKEGYTIPVLDHGFVRYLGHYGTDMTVVNAARVSYKSASKGPEADRKLLNYLWKNQHTSPFEMCKLHLNVKMPIFIMRQYIRHRMQNLNEVSARYTELPNEFYVPDYWRAQDTVNKQGSVQAELPHSTMSHSLSVAYEDAYTCYENLLKAGAAREMARMILPVGIYTEYQCVWDLKNLMHYMRLREDGHAQKEHQLYGTAIASICTTLFPWIMGAFRRYQLVMLDTETQQVTPK